MKLVVGLGNPGKQYAKTRHNVGFMVLDEFQAATIKDFNWSKWEVSKKCNAEISQGTKDGEKIILLKPLTYMNDSGVPTQLAINFYKLKPADLIVVHDDKDIALGEMKTQTDRGHAGHNGVRSIIECLSTQNFTRLRVGVASSDKKRMDDIPEFVLGKFGLFEKSTLKKSLSQATLELRKLL